MHRYSYTLYPLCTCSLPPVKTPIPHLVYSLTQNLASIYPTMHPRHPTHSHSPTHADPFIHRQSPPNTPVALHLTLHPCNLPPLPPTPTHTRTHTLALILSGTLPPSPTCTHPHPSTHPGIPTWKKEGKIRREKKKIRTNKSMFGYFSKCLQVHEKKEKENAHVAHLKSIRKKRKKRKKEHVHVALFFFLV